MKPEETARNNYDALLMAYAAGLLDEAQRLIVGAHMLLTPRARQMIHMCEALGGALMNTACEPVNMRAGSLQNVLARLDERTEPPTQPPSSATRRQLPPELEFMLPLLESLSCRTHAGYWQNLRTGIEIFDLDLPCRRSHAQCLKAAPDIAMPQHRESDVEITLVIEGSMTSECGHYRRGDLLVIDHTTPYAQRACPNTGGIYMIVNSTPTRGGGLTDWISRLFG